MLSARALRIAGVLPIAFFAWTLSDYARLGTLDEAFWICNVCNVLLGLAMLAGWAAGIWISSLWVIFGTPLWILDSVTGSGFQLHSFFTHLGSAVLGFLACRRFRPQGRVVLPALGLFVVTQLVTRVCTGPALNVNVAFRPYDGSEAYLNLPYPLYWLLTASLFALFLWALETLLRRSPAA